MERQPAIHPNSSDEAPTRASPEPASRRWWTALVLLALLCLHLNTWGLSWGMPGVTSWAPDSVAGTRTLRTIGTWPEHWPTHYPPFHFLINQLAYRPVLNHWLAQGEMAWVNPEDRTAPGSPGDPGVRPIFAPPVHEKVGLLVMISRVIAVLMSLGAVLATVASGSRLFGDVRCGLFAGLVLATCAEWVYFSHLGNLDVPHMFWFSLSVWAYIQACRTDAWRYFAALGVFTAFAVATKDAIAGMYVGIVVVLAVTRIRRARSSGLPGWRAAAAVVHGKMWVGLATFALPYAVIQGLFVAPRVCFDRIGYYLFGRGTTGFNQAYEGPLWLAHESVTVALKAMGWPMLIVAVASSVYAVIRWRRAALIALLPCAAYYLVVCSYTGMVYARMLFPVYLMLALLVGRASADWLSARRVPIGLRVGLLAALFSMSIGYCAAVDLEMVNDTRLRAEDWMVEHVPRDDIIGVFSHPQYLPRFLVTGHRARPIEMTPEAIAAADTPWLMLTSHNYDDYDEARRACLRRLLDGALGYEVRATFRKSYLPPTRPWFAVAGWATRGAGKVSPDIHILARVR